MGQLYSIYEETLKAIADSVRTVTGTIGDIPVEEFAVKIVEGGAALPELTNEGTAADLMANKELIDGEGNKVTGTFTIDSELTTQDNLISQIQTALEGKATATPKLQEKTATPTTSSQTITPDSTYDGLSKVTVAAIPSTYVKPTATKAATTYTPTTSNQTIAAGTYCSGAQTIKGDANLKAENIAEGVSIFGITGTHSGGSSGGGSSGGGSSVEACVGTIVVNAPNMDDFNIYALDDTLQVTNSSIDAMNGGSFVVAKGTIFAIHPWTPMYTATPNCTSLFSYRNGGAFIANGDFTLGYGG